MISRATALLVGATLVLGCGPYVEDVNKQRGARIEQKLSQVQAVGFVVASLPLTKEDEPGAGLASLALDPPKLGANAALIYAEDFANFDELGTVYARLPGANLVQRCASCLHTEREPWDPSIPSKTPAPIWGSTATALYDACEKLEQLFVIRTRAFLRPSVARPPAASSAAAGAGDAGQSDAAAADAGTPATREVVLYDFDGGLVDAELLVFDLRSARLWAATRFRAVSSERLDGHADDDAVERDLSSNVKTALTTAAQKNLHGVTVLP